MGASVAVQRTVTFISWGPAPYLQRIPWGWSDPRQDSQKNRKGTLVIYNGRALPWCLVIYSDRALSSLLVLYSGRALSSLLVTYSGRALSWCLVIHNDRALSW